MYTIFFFKERHCQEETTCLRDGIIYRFKPKTDISVPLGVIGSSISGSFPIGLDNSDCQGANIR